MKMTVAEIAELAGCSRSIVNMRIKQIMPWVSAGKGRKTMVNKEDAEKLLPTLPITNKDLIMEIKEPNVQNEVSASGTSESGSIIDAISKMQERQEAFMLKVIELITPTATITSKIEAPCPVPQLSAPAPEMSSRDRINKIVRGYCAERRIPYRDGWDRLYVEHKYRRNKNMKLKAKNRNMSTMDLFVKDVEIHNLLAIALEIYGE